MVVIKSAAPPQLSLWLRRLDILFIGLERGNSLGAGAGLARDGSSNHWVNRALRGFTHPTLKLYKLLKSIVITVILKKGMPMNVIPDDWSLAALLLFGGAFTALDVGIAVLLAESWFQKMRQRKEHDRIWQNRQLKTWQDLQRESFLRLSSDQVKIPYRTITATAILCPVNRLRSTPERRGHSPNLATSAVFGPPVSDIPEWREQGR
jgi:hypothetical protein